MTESKADANPTAVPENVAPTNEEAVAEAGAESGIGSGTEGGTESGIESGAENNSTSIHVESDAEPTTKEDRMEEEEIQEVPSDDSGTIASATRTSLRRRRRSRTFPKIFLIPTLVLLATVIFAVLLIINVIIKYNKNKKSVDEEKVVQTPAYPVAFDAEKERFKEIERQSESFSGENKYGLENAKEKNKLQTNFVLKKFTGLQKRPSYDDDDSDLIKHGRKWRNPTRKPLISGRYENSKGKFQGEIKSETKSVLPKKGAKKPKTKEKAKSKIKKPKVKSPVWINLTQKAREGKIIYRTNASTMFEKSNFPIKATLQNHKDFSKPQGNLSAALSSLPYKTDNQSQEFKESFVQDINEKDFRFHNNPPVADSSLSADATGKKLIEQKGSFLTALIAAAAAASKNDTDKILSSLKEATDRTKFPETSVDATVGFKDDKEIRKVVNVKAKIANPLIDSQKPLVVPKGNLQQSTPMSASSHVAIPSVQKNISKQLSKSSNAATFPRNLFPSESISLKRDKRSVYFIERKLNFSDATTFCRKNFNSNLFVPLNEKEEEEAMVEYKKFIAQKPSCTEVTLGYRMILSKQWHSSSKEQYFFGHLSSIWYPVNYQFAYRTCTVLQYRKRASQYYLTNKQCTELVTCHLCSNGPLPCIDQSCLFFVKQKDTTKNSNKVCRHSGGVAAEVYNFRQFRMLTRLVRILPNTAQCINFSLGMISSPAYENVEEKEIAYIPKRLQFASRLAKHSCTAIQSELLWLRSSCSTENCFACG